MPLDSVMDAINTLKARYGDADADTHLKTIGEQLENVKAGKTTLTHSQVADLMNREARLSREVRGRKDADETPAVDPRTVKKYLVKGTFYNQASSNKDDVFEETVDGENLSKEGANSAFYQKHGKKYPHYKISSIEEQEAGEQATNASEDDKAKKDADTWKVMIDSPNYGEYVYTASSKPQAENKMKEALKEKGAKARIEEPKSRQDAHPVGGGKVNGKFMTVSEQVTYKFGKPEAVAQIAEKYGLKKDGSSSLDKSSQDASPRHDGETARAGRVMNAEMVGKVADAALQIADRINKRMDAEEKKDGENDPSVFNQDGKWYVHAPWKAESTVGPFKSKPEAQDKLKDLMSRKAH